MRYFFRMGPVSSPLALAILVPVVFGALLLMVYWGIESFAPEKTEYIGSLVSVIDGDTLDVALDGQIERLRLIGIDTPERDECYYQEAKEALENFFLDSKLVVYYLGVDPKDKYDRWLAYVYTNDNLPVNEYLVSLGFADVMTISPNTKNADRYIQLRDQAKEEKLGMWGSCTY